MVRVEVKGVGFEVGVHNHPLFHVAQPHRKLGFGRISLVVNAVSCVEWGVSIFYERKIL
jgi:hypothetical protein